LKRQIERILINARKKIAPLHDRIRGFTPLSKKLLFFEILWNSDKGIGSQKATK